MKSSLLVLAITLMASCAYGQTLSITQVKQSERPIITKTESLIALQFTLTYPSDTIPYAIIYRVFMQDDSKEYYDAYAKQYSGFHNDKGRRVDIRFIVNGVTRDFTFKQFRKYLWPEGF